MADNGLKKEDDDKKGGILNMSSRLFVANVPPDKITNKEMRERFEKYGRVLDVYIGKSFAFVQFDNAGSADSAIKGETGTYIGENRIDCSLAKKQPRSVRQPEGGKGEPAGFRGGPSGFGAMGRGRERSPLRGSYDDRFDQRRFEDLDRYPPLRDFRDDPYRRDDSFYRELAEREAFLSDMEKKEPVSSAPRPPRPRTPEYILDMERKYVVQRRQLEDNETYHLERMRALKEEHSLKMEVLKLEKQALEMKIQKLSQGDDRFSNIPESKMSAPSFSYPNPSIGNDFIHGSNPAMPPAARGIMPLASSTSGMNASSNAMKGNHFGRRV